MIKFLVLAFFATTAYAQTFEGTFHAQEVEPIMVWEYVRVNCSQKDCGGNAWVRRGSKTIADLEVKWSIRLLGESSLSAPTLLDKKEIDKNFSAEALLTTFFSLSQQNLLVYAQNTKLEALSIIDSITGLTKKTLSFNSDWMVLDPLIVNETFESTIIVNKSELHFDQTLINLPITLTICVGQDRLLVHTTKPLGCQEIKATELRAGTVLLKDIKFANANPARDLVYFFDWKVQGTWLAGVNEKIPYAIFEE